MWPVSLIQAAPPAVRLPGRKIVLRTPQEADWQAWARVRGGNRERLQPLEPTWPEDCLGRDFFLRRLARQEEDWRCDRAYPFLLVTPETDALVGGINLNHVCRGAAQSASLGYWIDAGHEGKGLMSDAIRTLAGFAFGPLRLHRINAACLPRNDRSRALLGATGFAEEGMARAYLQIDGVWEDHVLFGLLAPE